MKTAEYQKIVEQADEHQKLILFSYDIQKH